MRLEQENDDLAHELVTSKIALRNDLDQVFLHYLTLSAFVFILRVNKCCVFRPRTKLMF